MFLCESLSGVQSACLVCESAKLFACLSGVHVLCVPMCKLECCVHEFVYEGVSVWMSVFMLGDECVYVGG